jgi:beta-1,2-mannobiose phosphorylase / 1,2-beta-oligomannan phosphorylase
MSNHKERSTRAHIVPRTAIQMVRRIIFRDDQLVPTHPILSPIAVLNPGFFHKDGRSFLIVRTDELVDDDHVRFLKDAYQCDAAVPYFDLREMAARAIPVNFPPDYDPDHDNLIVPPEFASAASVNREGLYLQYLSHLRIAEIDAKKDVLWERPIVTPSTMHDRYGCQDAHAVVLAGSVWITYNGLGLCGSTAQCCTLDRNLSISSRRMLFAPDQKHVSIFPERVEGRIFAVSRPLVRTYIKAAGVWAYCSNDGVHWKVLGPLLLPRDNSWDSARVGPGGPPILTADGWLQFYYGVDKEKSYHIGAVMLDRNDPMKVLSRSEEPIFSPSFEWELHGRRADSVFPSGAYFDSDDDRIDLYYGAADTSVAVAIFSCSDLIRHLSR